MLIRIYQHKKDRREEKEAHMGRSDPERTSTLYFNIRI